jgi:hypothetical protein
MQTILIGIAAGIASALMFLAPFGGTLLAFPLFALTGLPIAIGGLGWGLTASATAAATAALLIMAATSIWGAIVFLLLFAGPVIWVVRLALMWRETPGENGAAPVREWYPLGAMLAHLAVGVAIGVVIVGVLVGYNPESLVGEVTNALLAWFNSVESASAPPTAAELEPFVRFNIAAMPFTITALLVFVLVFDLWLAALIARASGRLERPRDRMWGVVLPGWALAVAAGALLLGIVPGVPGEIARVAAGGFIAAAALAGLAVLHALTAGMTGRAAALGIAYALLVLSGLPLFIFALLAVAEHFLGLRARRFKGVPPS